MRFQDRKICTSDSLRITTRRITTRRVGLKRENVFTALAFESPSIAIRKDLKHDDDASRAHLRLIIGRLTIDDARGLASDRAKLLVLQHAVDAAGRAAEAERRCDRTAVRSAALGTPDRAAGKAVLVVALIADKAVRTSLFGYGFGCWTCWKRSVDANRTNVGRVQSRFGRKRDDGIAAVASWENHPNQAKPSRCRRGLKQNTTLCPTQGTH